MPGVGTDAKYDIAANRRTPLQGLLQFGDPAKFIQRGAVVDLQQFALFQGSHVLDGDVHAFYIAENGAALFLQGSGEFSYFGCSCVKQLVEPLAEGGVVGSDRRQNSGMIEGSIERLFHVPNPSNNPRVQQGVQVGVGQRLLLQRIEAAQHLYMLLGERGHVGVGKNFDQGNFKGRKRQRTIEPITAALPLSRDARMAIKKSRD